MDKIARSAPVLPAYEMVPEIGEYDMARGRRWLVWCPHCLKIHIHSATAGHRAAHCRDSASPYSHSGYILERAGKIQAFSDARPGGAEFDGLPGRIREAAIDMRYTLLKRLVSGGERVPVGSGPDQFIAEVPHDGDAGAHYLMVELETLRWTLSTPRSQSDRSGQGLSNLLEFLYGLPAATVRRIITDALFADPPDAPDAGAALKIA